MAFGGTSWIIEPENGTLIATTLTSEPFVTIDIDPGWAETAKGTYPCYIPGQLSFPFATHQAERVK